MDTDVHRKSLSAMRIASFFVSEVICVNLRPIKFNPSQSPRVIWFRVKDEMNHEKAN